MSGRRQQLGDALKVMAPSEDFSWISRAAWRLHACAEPATDLRPRLRPADEVLQLAIDMMRVRDGLVIAFLTLRPIRSKNLSSLTIGTHLKRRGAAWWVHFAEGEGKTQRSLEFPWPGQFVEALERYLAAHRPTLLECPRRGAQPGEALWISRHGTAMTSDALSVQVNARTGEEFGEPINLHSFRHIAATTIATVDPENASYIAAVLGHSGPGSSDRHYNRARAIDAGRRYQSVLEDVRRAQPRPRAEAV